MNQDLQIENDALIRMNGFQVCWKKSLLRKETLNKELVHHTTFESLHSCIQKYIEAATIVSKKFTYQDQIFELQ